MKQTTFDYGRSFRSISVLIKRGQTVEQGHQLKQATIGDSSSFDGYQHKSLETLPLLLLTTDDLRWRLLQLSILLWDQHCHNAIPSK